MNIKRRGLMQNVLGLVGAIAAIQAGIKACYIVDDRITVLQRNDGSYSFKDHYTGQEPAQNVQDQIIKEIQERKL
jgi:hypothetical protein|nr:MAG TPA: hypothetical protein [Caudoviricetes sp.]